LASLKCRAEVVLAIVLVLHAADGHLLTTRGDGSHHRSDRQGACHCSRRLCCGRFSGGGLLLGSFGFGVGCISLRLRCGSLLLGGGGLLLSCRCLAGGGAT